MTTLELLTDALTALQQTPTESVGAIAVLAGAAGMLLNLIALAVVFIRIGRFEGRVETKLETIEQKQSVSVSSDLVSAIRNDIARLERLFEKLDDEKVSEHRVRNLIAGYAEELAKVQRGEKGPRGRDL